MFNRLVLLPTRVLAAAVVVIPIAMVVVFNFDGPYRWHILIIAFMVLGATIAVAWIGFVLSRRFLKWFLKPLKRAYDDGFNDAISGALGAIGVFYGVTVGLIAIDVWQRHSNAEDLVSREAAAIQVLYLMVKSDIGGTKPQPGVTDPTKKDDAEQIVRERVAEYLQDIVCVKWKEQQDGTPPPIDKRLEGKAAGKRLQKDWQRLKEIRQTILEIEPEKKAQEVRYAATIQSLNHLSELNRLRGDATKDRLSGVMWMIIIVGAMMSMCVVYLFKLKRPKFHALLVCLLATFLGFVLLMILLNDRPFIGKYAVDSTSYMALGWIVGDAERSAKNGQEKGDKEKQDTEKWGTEKWDAEICPRYLAPDGADARAHGTQTR